MKMKFLFTLIFIAFFSKLYSQNDTIIYFDENWGKTDRNSATFYRIIYNYKVKQKLYKITDFYISGEKQMEGFLKDLVKEKKSGLFIWYFKNGQKSTRVNFKNNIAKGLKEEWYPNGRYLVTCNCKKNGCYIYQAWDSIGIKIADNGKGYYFKIYENGKIEEKTEILAGLNDGKSYGYYKDGKLYYEEDYHIGKFLKGISYDSTGMKYEYNTIEQNALFQGGDIYTFRTYIVNNIKYPENLLDYGISDKVIIQFTVMPNGDVANIKLLKPSIYMEFNQEAYSVVNNSPKWIPGKIRGIKTKQKFVMPFKFIVKE